MNIREEAVPKILEEQLQANGPDLGTLLRVMPYLPEAIKAMSDQFVVFKNNKTPWDMDAGFEAYFYYFHVLNTVRMMSVLRHLKACFPDLEAERITDLGSGLGSVQLAFASVFPKLKPRWTFVEPHAKAKRWHQKICSLDEATWVSNLEGVEHQADSRRGQSVSHVSSDTRSGVPSDIFFASYCLNEMERLPQEALEAKHLVLLEPSSQFYSRRVMALRPSVIEAGFKLLAPCTHAQACPLLAHSKHDFCHDRIHFRAPPWFVKIEDRLPMRNRTLTFSYLIASKELSATTDHSLRARVLGDTLKEKGKTRQAICRGSEKEFLSWLKRDGKAPFLPHGSLIELETEPEKKGNELRPGLGKIKQLT